MEKNRAQFIDIAKGIAIFLVIWMHCIQYLHHESFENNLYAAVYSFHMPLFLIISGYLFYPSISRPTIGVIKKRAIRLLLPNMLWGGVLAIYLSNYSYSVVFTSFWFLNTLFIGSVLYLFFARMAGTIISTIFLTFAVLLIPGCEYIKFSIPFIGIGLCMKQYNVIERLSDCPILLLLSDLAVILLYVFLWNKSWYIYVTHSPSYVNPIQFEWIAFFARIIYGSIASIAILASLIYLEKRYNLRSNSIINYLSTNSLGLYVIHLFFLIIVSETVYSLIKEVIDSPAAINIVSFFIAVLMTAFIGILIRLFKRHYLLRHIC